MKILAIDTTSKICSVALLEDNNLIDEINLDSGLTHSENLMPIVKQILEKNKLTIKNIELIGVDCGPGSYTGIRIGIASVKAIAEICKIPVVSVTSLETLAKNVDSKGIIASIIDARNNQVYFGVFDSNYNKLEEYLADDINFIIEKLRKYDNLTLVGDGALLHEEILVDSLENIGFSYISEQYARNVGYIAYKKYIENKDVKDADTILPIYLRNKM